MVTKPKKSTWLMFKKLFLFLAFFVLMLQSVNSALGVYEAGDTVTYSVVCLNDESNKDTGCSAPDDDILDPDDTTAKSPTSALAELSDANFPGKWRGSYDIPAASLIGTWSIFIELTNSNGTAGATTLSFQVVSDKWATPTNVTDLNDTTGAIYDFINRDDLATQTNTSKIETDLQTLSEGIDSNLTTANETSIHIIADLENIDSDIQTLSDGITGNTTSTNETGQHIISLIENVDVDVVTLSNDMGKNFTNISDDMRLAFKDLNESINYTLAADNVWKYDISGLGNKTNNQSAGGRLSDVWNKVVGVSFIEFLTDIAKKIAEWAY